MTEDNAGEGGGVLCADSWTGADFWRTRLWADSWAGTVAIGGPSFEQSLGHSLGQSFGHPLGHSLGHSLG